MLGAEQKPSVSFIFKSSDGLNFASVSVGSHQSYFLGHFGKWYELHCTGLSLSLSLGEVNEFSGGFFSPLDRSEAIFASDKSSEARVEFKGNIGVLRLPSGRNIELLKVNKDDLRSYKSKIENGQIELVRLPEDAFLIRWLLRAKDGTWYLAVRSLFSDAQKEPIKFYSGQLGKWRELSVSHFLHLRDGGTMLIEFVNGDVLFVPPAIGIPSLDREAYNPIEIKYGKSPFMAKDAGTLAFPLESTWGEIPHEYRIPMELLYQELNPKFPQKGDKRLLQLLESIEFPNLLSIPDDHNPCKIVQAISSDKLRLLR